MKMNDNLSRSKFFDLLFNEHEYLCLADSPKGIKIYSLDKAKSEDHNFLFYSLNPINGKEDVDPIKEWHRKDKPRRADANVTRISNILLEFDSDNLATQWQALKTSGLINLCAGITFSGSKSLHAVISLHESFKDKDNYSEFVNHLYKIVEEILHIRPDFSTKNPSRLTRCPNSYREKNGKSVKQQLLYLGKRISVLELQDWFERNGFSRYPEKKFQYYNDPSFDNNLFWSAELWPSTRDFLLNGARPGEIHTKRYKAACDMANKGWELADIINQMQNSPCGIPNSNALKTIQDAYKKVIDKRKTNVSIYGDLKIGKTNLNN